MKTQSLSTLVALASGINVVAATGWLDASAFKCPTNTDNHCNPKQHSGYDWGDLSTGPFQQYGGLDFNNWSCSNSFGPRKRTNGGSGGNNFQSKCITGVAHSDRSSCPSFGGGSSPGFSVDSFQVSVEFDCHLDFHYGMPDGSTCKQSSPCSRGGSTVKNTQCGGAKNVTVVYPGGGPKKTCSIGVHSIGFDCSSHTTPTYSATTLPHQSTTVSVPSYPTTTPSYPTTTPSYPTTESAPETIPSSTPSQSAPVSTPSYATTESAPETTPPTYVTSTIYTTSVHTITSCAPTITNCPAHSTVVTTVTIPVSTTVCPVTETESSPSSYSTGVAPPYQGTNGTSTAAGTTPTYAPSSTVQGTYPASSASPLPYPSILPQCLNTWVPMGTECSSNAAADCYCSSESLICSVYECLYAHGATDSDVAQAQDYLKGICVNHIGSNPAILTCSTEVSSPTTYPAGPVTTVTVVTTVVVPCSESGSAIPYSSTTSVYTTSVVVPQVVLSTIPGPASTVALVTGTPAPAATTYPTGAPQTIPAPQTTLAAVTVPGPASNSTGTALPPFTNSASQTGLGFSSLMAAVIFIAAFAL